MLGDVRRRLVEVKRFIDPERNALTQLVLRKLEWAEPRSMEALVQAIQVLNGLGAGLEGLYERAKLLQDEIAVALSEDINRKLLWLAIMSALLLPATLVTGHLRHKRGGPAGHERSGVVLDRDRRDGGLCRRHDLSCCAS